MNISVQKLPNCLAKLDVEFPADLVSKERENLVKSFMNQARIPGFRPSKAPRAIIEKRFTKELTEELEGRLMDQAIRETLKQESDLKIIDFQRPEHLDHQSDGSARMVAKLIVAPEFTLPEYKGLEIEVPKLEVNDKTIDHQIQRLRERNADYPDREGRPVESGDIIVFSHTATIDGVAPSEIAGQSVDDLESTNDYWIRVDANAFLPNFAPQLIGANIGDTREVVVTLPDDGPLKPLCGKEVVCQVTINAIKEEILPDDEKLLSTIMPGGTMDDIREIMEQQAKQELARQKHDVRKEQLFAKLTSAVDFELPEEFVSSEKQTQTDHLVNNALRRGASEDEIKAHQEKIFETADALARLNLKTQFLLSEIAAAEKLQPTEHEVYQHIEFLAHRNGKNTKSLLQKLVRNGRIDSIRYQLMIGKTVDFLLEHAKVTEIEATNDESQSAE